MTPGLLAHTVSFLSCDFAVAFLPASYFRCRFRSSDGERLAITAPLCVAVGAFALSLFADHCGTWLRLLAVAAAQAASIAILWPWRWRLVGGLLGLSAAALTKAHESEHTLAGGCALAVAAAAIAAAPAAASLAAMALERPAAASASIAAVAVCASHGSAVWRAVRHLLLVEEVGLAHASARRVLGDLETHLCPSLLCTFQDLLGGASFRRRQPRDTPLDARARHAALPARPRPAGRDVRQGGAAAEEPAASFARLLVSISLRF